jgi:lipopolysaccharide/colanic/teichoic acid biosynthesis glycosyltransferase
MVSANIAFVISYPALRVSTRLIGSQFPPNKIQSVSPWVASRARRFLDCVFAIIALTALLPVLGLCWVLVRFSSQGPVFFSQHRMGRNGNEFILYKFRSMRTPGSVHAPSHTVQDDDRITPVGRFLRRYKLDELPQFWNVVKGEMSLVGPRPKLSHHEALHMPYRPGLSGKATLAFRNEERMLLRVPRHRVDHFYQAVVKPLKAELDSSYMERATPASDLRIIWRTFTSCLNSSEDPCEEVATLMEEYASNNETLEGAVLHKGLLTMKYEEENFRSEMEDLDYAGGLDDAA